jgi:hypothetical protein
VIFIIIVIVPQKIFILTVIDRRIKNHRTNTSHLASDTLMKSRRLVYFKKLKHLVVHTQTSNLHTGIIKPPSLSRETIPLKRQFNPFVRVILKCPKLPVLPGDNITRFHGNSSLWSKMHFELCRDWKVYVGKSLPIP